VPKRVNNPRGNPESLGEASQASRFFFAKERISKIADGRPALNDEQRRELAGMLWPHVTDDPGESQ
jgi:hypothetical protein